MISISADQKEIKSNKTFQYGNKIVEYNLIQSKRRKTYEVIVDKNGITIRSPFDKSIEEIEQILNDKIKWIFVKQKEIQIQEPEIIKPLFVDHSTLPFLGKNYGLKIIYDKNISKERIEFVNNTFTVYLFYNLENTSINKVKFLYESWLNFQAKGIFKEKVTYFSNLVEVHPKKIVIKNLKNR